MVFSFLIADTLKKLLMSLFISYLILTEPSEAVMLILVQSVEKFLDSQLFGLEMKYRHTCSYGNFVFRKARIYYSVSKGHRGLYHFWVSKKLSMCSGKHFVVST